MISISECKRIAKEKLGGGIFKDNWMLALAACAVQSIVLAAASGVMIVVLGPLSVGLTAVFVATVKRGEKIDVGKMFTAGFGGGMFGRNFLLGFLRNLFVALWSLLFVIPGIIKSYAYAMSDFIAAEHTEYDWRQCIDESKRIMDGHKWDLFVLDLSFIGWYIVGALCLGIGTLWVVPYHQTARVAFFNSLTAE